MKTKKIILIAISFLFFCASAQAADFTVSSHSSGSYYSMALKPDGTLWAWGHGGYANLGDGSFTDHAPEPKQIGTDTWSKVVATTEHTRAINGSGEMYAWGRNQYGYSGFGTCALSGADAYIETPTKTGGGTADWKDVFEGMYASYAIKTDNTLWTAGLNNHGQLGRASTELCYGDDGIQNMPSSTLFQPVGSDTWTVASGGFWFSAGVTTDGRLMTWGYQDSSYCQLGDGTCVAKDVAVPTQIASDKQWSAVSSGYFHVLALDSEGHLYAWGWNPYGQVGDGTLVKKDRPTLIGTLDDHWLSISAGYYHSLAVKSDGTLWAWGYNTYGQVGDGTTADKNIPTQIMPGTSDWSSVSAGRNFSTARNSGGYVYAWGNNHREAVISDIRYQLGQGISNTADSPTPLLVGNSNNPISPTAYYVSPAGGATKTGTKDDPFNIASIPWSAMDDNSQDFVLYFFGGSYVDTLTISHATQINKIYIRPCSASPSPGGCESEVVFSGLSGSRIKMLNADNIIIDGETSVGSGTRNIKITPGDGIGIDGFTGGSGSTDGIVLRYLEITGVDDDTPKQHAASMGDTFGVKIYATTDTEIAYCYFHDNWCKSDILVYVNNDTAAYGKLKVHHNTFKAGGADYLIGNANTDVYDNSFDNTTGYNPYDILHFYVGPTQKAVRNVRVYNNFFDTPDTSIFLENGSSTGCAGSPCPTEDIEIYNNVIACSTPVSFSGVFEGGRSISLKSDQPDAAKTMDSVLIANNTFVNLQKGFNLTGPATNALALSNFTVKNNIWYEASSNSYYTDNNNFIVKAGTVNCPSSANFVVDNNLFYDNDGIDTYLCSTEGGVWTKYSTLANINSHSGPNGNNGVNAEGNPNFSETTSYTLGGQSANAVDKGTDLSSYFATDKAGASRPQGSAWDIGAFEYVSGSDTTPPGAPSDLSVD